MNNIQTIIMTNEQADYLIGLKKKILEDNKPVDEIIVNQTFPFHCKFDIVSEENDEFMFIWEIAQSAKNSLRISLHYQEDESKIGLMRVDYNSGHHNPEVGNDTLPERFRPFVGAWLNDSHVHYHVDGYKSLAWAIPLERTDFEIKQIGEMECNQQLMNAIQDFARKINIVTEIKINPMLI